MRHFKWILAADAESLQTSFVQTFSASLNEDIERAVPTPFGRYWAIVEGAAQAEMLKQCLARDAKHGINAGLQYVYLQQWASMLAELLQTPAAAGGTAAAAQAAELLLLEKNPYTAARLRWPLFALLRANLTTNAAVLRPLQRYLRRLGSATAQFHFAAALAYVFEKYAFNRPQLLQSWETPATEPLPAAELSAALGVTQELVGTALEVARWQGWLWRKLRITVGAMPKTQILARIAELLAHLDSTTQKLVQTVMPRLFVYELQYLPPPYLQVLHALAQVVPVTIFKWDLAALAPAAELPLAGLATRRTAFYSWLSTAPECPPPAALRLASLKPAESAAPAPAALAALQKLLFTAETAPAAAAATLMSALEAECTQTQQNPRSLQFFSTVTPAQEIMQLHAQLLSLFCSDHTLRPADVCIVTPQLERYAPLLRAVFTAGGVFPLTLPAVARAVKAETEACLAMTELLVFCAQSAWSLRECRRVVAAVVPVDARVPNGARHFMQALGQAFKLHAAPLFGQYTGVRMALTELCAFTRAWAAGSPQLAAAEYTAVLRWAQLFAQLANLQAMMTQRALNVSTWRRELLRIAAEYYAALGASAAAMTRLQRALEQFFAEFSIAKPQPQPTAAQPAQQREEWRIEQSVLLLALRQALLCTETVRLTLAPALAAGIRCASLKALRGLSARVVCVVGLDAGQFPQSAVKHDFDLMSHFPQPADRDPQGDDELLLLEWLRSAQAAFWLSFTQPEPTAQTEDEMLAVWLSAAAEPVQKLFYWLSAQLKPSGIGTGTGIGTEPVFSSAAVQLRLWKALTAATHPPVVPYPHLSAVPLNAQLRNAANPFIQTETQSVLAERVFHPSELRLWQQFSEQAAPAQRRADNVDNANKSKLFAAPLAFAAPALTERLSLLEPIIAAPQTKRLDKLAPLLEQLELPKFYSAAAIAAAPPLVTLAALRAFFTAPLGWFVQTQFSLNPAALSQTMGTATASWLETFQDAIAAPKHTQLGRSMQDAIAAEFACGALSQTAAEYKNSGKKLMQALQTESAVPAAAAPLQMPVSAQVLAALQELSMEQHFTYMRSRVFSLLELLQPQASPAPVEYPVVPASGTVSLTLAKQHFRLSGAVPLVGIHTGGAEARVLLHIVPAPLTMGAWLSWCLELLFVNALATTPAAQHARRSSRYSGALLCAITDSFTLVSYYCAPLTQKQALTGLKLMLAWSVYGAMLPLPPVITSVADYMTQWFGITHHHKGIAAKTAMRQVLLEEEQKAWQQMFAPVALAPYSVQRQYFQSSGNSELALACSFFTPPLAAANNPRAASHSENFFRHTKLSHDYWVELLATLVPQLRTQIVI